MDITDAKATDLTDTAGACAILACSPEWVRQLVTQDRLRCFQFEDGVLVERQHSALTRGRDLLFLREDVKAVPPRTMGYPAGRPRHPRKKVQAD